MTFCIMTLNITKLCRNAECRCAYYRNLFIVMLNVILLSFVMLNIVEPLNNVKHKEIFFSYLSI
jgi:hypothetical protein